MTKYRWSFEGVANGTAFTSATNVSTSPTGMAATNMSNGSGSNASDNTHVHTGSQALKAVVPVSSTQNYRIPFAAANAIGAASIPWWLSATPGANFQWVHFRHASGICFRLQINSAGKLILLDAAGSGTIATSTASLTFGQWVRFEVVFNTTAGNITVNAYYGDDTTTVVATVTGTGASIGSGAAVAAIDLGAPSGNGTGATLTQWFDDVQLNDGATTEIGPYIVSNVLPTATITPNQNLAAGIAGTATVTPTDSDGSIASQTWSVDATRSTATLGTLTNTGATTVNFATTPAAGNVVTLQADVVDNSGGHATPIPSTEVRVPLSGATTLVPLAFDGTNVAGTMTRVGSATTDGAALADASDATYIESGTVSGTEQSERYRWQPSNLRSAAAAVLRLGTDTGTANAIVRLYEGATLRQTFTTQAINATPTDYTFTLTSGTVAAISDWGNLYLEVAFTS
jgi:hypothetical protein